MRRHIAVLLAGVLLLPGVVSGQALQPGSVVRFSQPGEGTHTGTVVALTADTLKVQLTGSAEPARLPLDQVTRLEVSRGRERHPGYAGVGALIGLSVGAVGGFAAGEDDCRGKWVCINRPGGALLGGGIFGAAGAVLGLVAGAIPSESWERVHLEGHRVGLVTPPVGQGVGLRFAL